MNPELCHGYTMADLHSLARFAVHLASYGDASWHERYGWAWSAIAEALYAANEPPTRQSLLAAGQVAIYDEIQSHRQRYGYYRAKTDGSTHGAGSSPAFRTYWMEWLANSSQTFERNTVERLALRQILPMLREHEAVALIALAVHDDYQAAADAVGVPYATFKSQIARARARFFALWHEGETPSKPWGVDRRAGAKAGTRRSNAKVITTLRRRSRAA